MKLRVLLADDHEIMRNGLRPLLQQEPGIGSIAGLTKYAIRHGITTVDR